IGLELPFRREHEVDERRGDGPEHEQQRALEPAPDPARLDQRRGENDDGGLHEHVAVANVRELVREHALELCRRCSAEEPTADRNGSAADRESTRLNSSHVASSYAVFLLKKKNFT